MWQWTGQHRQLEQTRERLKGVVPLTLAVMLLLLWWHFRSIVQALIVLLSVPFALVGSVWLLWLLDYRLSTAVWVGIIALVGLAAQTGVVMIVYIDHAYLKRKAAGQVNGLEDIVQAHFEGTVQRVRPKLMTVATMLAGLLPLLWSEGSGADVMRRIAAPMVGGLFSSAFLTLEIIPVVYTWWRFEELIWERLADRAPAMLATLHRLSLLQATGWLLAGLVLVSPLYIDLPLAARIAPGLLAVSLVGIGFAGYRRHRRAARRLAWPA
jgi:Cu(I)/Ag(I) efflux system membrane protein CusA/SilA